ncbi:hypothetical protein IM753_08870 [Moraxella sp. K127]|uniref:hypothetical protein n=1 Tax=Moraxella sp. K127 TaxID=2780079 RepID=UPI0018824FC6|nr:hypothetical protein [Moraxella sp. K127]MBE9591085.1 hypothetical protein [Moraxella sp. K127]
MSKRMMSASLSLCMILPIMGFANPSYSLHADSDKALIGKWQCHVKHANPLIKQESQLQFFKNHTMHEHIRIYYGQPSDYAYQIESAIAKSSWTLAQETLHYGNHQFHNYAVRMPNANKYDLEQANIALQKSLPMVQDMMNNDINKRAFDIHFINKKSFIMNDVDSQIFTTCHKQGLFGFYKE